MNKRRQDDEASFAGLLNLGSTPPPASGSGPVDVYAATTAVAVLPKGLLEELRRAADPDASTERRRFEPPAEANAFTDEAPTTPGKEKERAAVPPLETPDLLAAVNAALAAAGAAKLEAQAPNIATQATRVMPAFAFPTPEQRVPHPSPVLARRPRRWMRVLLGVLVVLLVALAGAFAGRRFVHRR